MRALRRLVPSLAAVLVLAACGSDDGSSGAGGAEQVEGSRPAIVVTTSILGDVVSSLVGEAATVDTVMPPGASPHDFQASAQQARAMREADLLIVNGAGFEEGLLDVIAAAEADGVPVHEAIAPVAALAFDPDDDDHAEEEEEGDDHAGEEEGDGHADEEDDHGHDGLDPHFFTDPARMAVAAEGILDALARHVPALDTEEVRATARAAIDGLGALDAEVEAILAPIPAPQRILVTNHEVFGYFADRYGFAVVGTVIPSGTTAGGSSARDLSELAHVLEEEGVKAVFADTSSPSQLAEALAAEVGDVEVVELFSESLGGPGSEGETYRDMVRTNAERIAGALA